MSSNETRGTIAKSIMSAIAGAIRYVNGSQTQYKPTQMEDAIKALKKILVLKSISANGVYNPSSDSADGYSSVEVNVPNSYSAGDEGKVVNNGALVLQTARAEEITHNGTVDTTINNSVTVNVSGGATLITKSITQNGTYNASSDNADGYSSVIVNSSPIRYEIGEYYGSIDGTSTGSLTGQVGGKINAVAILVVMHRSALTVPSGWTLVDHRDNPMTTETGNIPQQISILKHTIVSTTEWFTVSQANSSARMCACIFYFDSDPQLLFATTLEMDSTAEKYRYEIPPLNKPSLVVISNIYSGISQGSNIMMPEQAFPASKRQQKYFNTGTATTSCEFRLLAFVNTAISEEIVQFTGLTASADALSLNRAFIYTIG